MKHPTGTKYVLTREANWVTYGIVQADGRPLSYPVYLAVLRFQGGGCAICGRSRFWGSLHADHDRKTGLFRGVLCEQCNNRAIGAFEKRGKYGSPEQERILKEYLQHPPYQKWLRS